MSRGNVVIAGDFAGSAIMTEPGGRLVLMANSGPMYLNNETIAKYEVANDSQSRSTGSAVKRAVVGKALLGRKGMVAGAATAKKVTSYEVSVDFKSGQRSLLQLDEAAYKLLVRSSF